MVLRNRPTLSIGTERLACLNSPPWRAAGDPRLARGRSRVWAPGSAFFLHPPFLPPSGDSFFRTFPTNPAKVLGLMAWLTATKLPKSFASPGKKLLYFKNGKHENNSVCLVIYIGALALIWYLIFEKWVWKNEVLHIWTTLGHIRKVAVLKSRTHPHLSCLCHPGFSKHTDCLYSPVKQDLSLHICIMFRDQS